MIEDAMNGGERSGAARLFLVMAVTALLIISVLTVHFVIDACERQVVCNNTKLLFETEQDRTIRGGVPTEVGTNDNPMEWDRNYAKMLPVRISCVLDGVRVIYRSQAVLNAYQASVGADVHKTWDGSPRDPAAAFYTSATSTIYLSIDGKWSYATMDGDATSVVMHELGHAYDGARGNLSSCPKYDFTHEPCLKGDPYFKDVKEAFAEVFSIYFTADRSSLSAHARACMADFARN